jgi:hypothetical protein
MDRDHQTTSPHVVVVVEVVDVDVAADEGVVSVVGMEYAMVAQIAFFI